MEGDQHALEQVARDMVELYGGDAPRMLLERAEIADKTATSYEQKHSAGCAAIATRLARRL
jgi:hypothetical protein